MYACTSDEWVNDLNISICTMNHKLFLITFWIYISTSHTNNSNQQLNANVLYNRNKTDNDHAEGK